MQKIKSYIYIFCIYTSGYFGHHCGNGFIVGVSDDSAIDIREQWNCANLVRQIKRLIIDLYGIQLIYREQNKVDDLLAKGGAILRLLDGFVPASRYSS